MKVHCHICNLESSFVMNKDGFDLYECPKCKLIFVYPQPSADFLKNEVYSYESGFQSNRAENLSQIKQKYRYKKVIDNILLYKKNGKLLDVGCGGGHFMYWAKNRGLFPVGVELNKRTADSAKSQGFEVFNGFLHDAPYEEKSFDVVVLGEIIEHVNSPRDLIFDCQKFLSEDGILVITTPNINCFWSKSTLWFYRIFKIPWSTSTPPYHLYQFDNNNLDILLEEKGFKSISETYLLPPSLKYELGSLHLWKRYKQSRKISDLIFMIFSFCIYILFYGINFILHPILPTDFQMIKIYSKD